MKDCKIPKEHSSQMATSIGRRDCRDVRRHALERCGSRQHGLHRHLLLLLMNNICSIRDVRVSVKLLMQVEKDRLHQLEADAAQKIPASESGKTSMSIFPHLFLFACTLVNQIASPISCPDMHPIVLHSKSNIDKKPLILKAQVGNE